MSPFHVEVSSRRADESGVTAPTGRFWRVKSTLVGLLVASILIGFLLAALLLGSIIAASLIILAMVGLLVATVRAAISRVGR